MNIDIRPKDLEIVQQILTQHLPSEAKIYVFGSRAKGTTKRSSDLDLAIDLGRRLVQKEEFALAFAFEDSNLPYKVDVVDLHAVSASFKNAIEGSLVEFTTD
jgi:predicted nucleotidyltransferase